MYISVHQCRLNVQQWTSVYNHVHWCTLLWVRAGLPDATTTLCERWDSRMLYVLCCCRLVQSQKAPESFRSKLMLFSYGWHTMWNTKVIACSMSRQTDFWSLVHNVACTNGRMWLIMLGSLRPAWEWQLCGWSLYSNSLLLFNILFNIKLVIIEMFRYYRPDIIPCVTYVRYVYSSF